MGEGDVPTSGVVIAVDGDEEEKEKDEESGGLLVASSSEAISENGAWPHHSRTASESSGKTYWPP